MSKKLKVGIFNFRENLFDVFLKSFAAVGAEVDKLELEKSSWQDFEAWFTKGQFDLLLTGNFVAFHDWKFGRDLEKYLSEKSTPCLIWHWEKIFFSGNGYLKKRLSEGALAKNFIFLVTDKNDIAALAQHKVSAHYLPLAVDDSLVDFRPSAEQRARLSHDLSYSGTPFRLEGVKTSDEDELRRGFVVNNLLEFYSRAKSEAGISTPKSEVNAQVLNALNQVYANLPANYHSFQKKLSDFKNQVRPILDSKLFQFFENYKARVAYIYSYFQLSIYLQRLRKFDLRVYGSDMWCDFLSNYPHPIPRLSENDFYALAASSKITFCLTKLQFEEFVHERSMMTLACGGFPLTDYREALHDLFEPDEIISYRSFEEAEDLIRFYLKNDTARLSVAQKGQKRVHGSHLYRHRIRKMLEIAHQEFGT